MLKIISLSWALAVVLIAASAGPAFYVHARTPNEAWSTFLGTNQPDLQPNRIRVEYEEPHSAELQPVYKLMMRRHPLQKIREIFSPLRLPLELTVTTKECGLSNKGYLPKGRVPACKTEWNEVDFAFHNLIYPYLDPELLNDVLSKSWVPYAHVPLPRMTDLPQPAPPPPGAEVQRPKPPPPTMR